MSNTLQMGAIDIDTNSYSSPSQALKGKNYKCVDCGNRVILRKGDIRVHHFAHYTQTNTCSYYEHPNESQIHKDAKLLMAKLLTDKKHLEFVWGCDYPPCYKTLSNCNAFSEIPTITYKEGDEVILEYRDKDNKWIADVALVNNGEVRYIIEIKHTHSTGLGRPEPWFEIDATSFIISINEQEKDKDDAHADDWEYYISCERKNIKRYCYGSFCYKEPWVKKIPSFNMLVNPCVLCQRIDYEPVMDGYTEKFINGKIRCCTDCLVKDTYEKKLRALYEQPKNLKTCRGSCFKQSNTLSGYDRIRTCEEKCTLVQCPRCYNPHPQEYLDCHDGYCIHCHIEKIYNIYINVPYDKKEEAKLLGAKWDKEKKKWYVERFNKNYNAILSRFK